jgi:hypothetical protein
VPLDAPAHPRVHIGFLLGLSVALIISLVCDPVMALGFGFRFPLLGQSKLPPSF